MALINQPKTEITKAQTQWRRVRDFVNGEEAVKGHDSKNSNNLDNTYLIPFNSQMDSKKFKIYLREAQLPGVTATQHAALVGALLRRTPDITLPEGAAWVMESFGNRGEGLISWLNTIIDDQLTTSANYVLVDYPDTENISERQRLEDRIRPYPVEIKAEQRLGEDFEYENGKEIIKRFRYNTTKNELQDDGTYKDVVITTVLRLDDETGDYTIETFNDSGDMLTSSIPKKNGAPLKFIPIWPLSGTNEIIQPYLHNFVNTEQHLYNKVSRRNHSYYLANTSTIYATGVSDSDKIGALGGVWKIGEADAKVGVLSLPTDIIANSDTVIKEEYFNIAAMGARMFADTGREAETAEALSIKNQAAHSMLANLASKLSDQIGEVIKFTIEWDTNSELDEEALNFELSKDFIPTKLSGQDLTALATAYQQGMIPISVYYYNLRQGEFVPEDMTLEEFTKEVNDEMPLDNGNDDVAASDGI